MKVIYIAHPISGNVKENLKNIAKIARMINLGEPDIVPIAPCFLNCHALNDIIPRERERGIRNDTELLNKGFIDEIRLYGNRISEGMKQEIKLACKLGISVIPMTKETKLWKQIKSKKI